MQGKQLWEHSEAHFLFPQVVWLLNNILTLAFMKIFFSLRPVMLFMGKLEMPDSNSIVNT